MQLRVARQWKEEDCSVPICLKSQRRDWLHMHISGVPMRWVLFYRGVLFPSTIDKGINTAETTMDRLARICANEHQTPNLPLLTHIFFNEIVTLHNDSRPHLYCHQKKK